MAAIFQVEVHIFLEKKVFWSNHIRLLVHILQASLLRGDCWNDYGAPVTEFLEEIDYLVIEQKLHWLH